MSDADRWTQLLALAEALAAVGPSPSPPGPEGEQRLREITSALLAVQELFPKSTDPVDDYEAYCVRRFCKALLQAVEALRE